MDLCFLINASDQNMTNFITQLFVICSRNVKFTLLFDSLLKYATLEFTFLPVSIGNINFSLYYRNI